MSEAKVNSAPPLPTYTEPESTQHHRNTVRDTWRGERAGLYVNLIALVPTERQPEAMTYVLQLETLHTNHTATLQTRWYASIQAAFMAGLQKNLMVADDESPSSTSGGAPVH